MNSFNVALNTGDSKPVGISDLNNTVDIIRPMHIREKLYVYEKSTFIEEASFTGGLLSNGTAVSSDKRYKTSIQPLEDVWDEFKKLKTVSWYDTDGCGNIVSDMIRTGVIAQDIESDFDNKIFNDTIWNTDSGRKYVTYLTLHNINLKVTQQLQQKVEELKEENNKYKNLIANMDERIKKLEEG